MVDYENEVYDKLVELLAELTSGELDVNISGIAGYATSSYGGTIDVALHDRSGVGITSTGTALDVLDSNSAAMNTSLNNIETQILADDSNVWTTISERTSTSAKLIENTSGNRYKVKIFSLNWTIDATQTCYIKFNDTGANTTNCFINYSIFGGALNLPHQYVIQDFYLEDNDYIYAYLDSCGINYIIQYREL